MISGLNEQLQQRLEYTLLKPDCHSWRISKMQSEHEDSLQEQYAIKFCFKTSLVIDTLTQEDFHGAFEKLLEQYKCIAAGGDYFEGGLEFHVCTIYISAHTKMYGNLFNDPRITVDLFMVNC